MRDPGRSVCGAPNSRDFVCLVNIVSSHARIHRSAIVRRLLLPRDARAFALHPPSAPSYLLVHSRIRPLVLRPRITPGVLLSGESIVLEPLWVPAITIG